MLMRFARALQEGAVVHVRLTATAIFSKSRVKTPRCLPPGLYRWHGQKKEGRKEEKTAAAERRAAILAFNSELNVEPSHLIVPPPTPTPIQMSLICSPEVNAQGGEKKKK